MKLSNFAGWKDILRIALLYLHLGRNKHICIVIFDKKRSQPDLKPHWFLETISFKTDLKTFNRNWSLQTTFSFIHQFWHFQNEIVFPKHQLKIEKFWTVDSWNFRILPLFIWCSTLYSTGSPVMLCFFKFGSDRQKYSSQTWVLESLDVDILETTTSFYWINDVRHL